MLEKSGVDSDLVLIDIESIDSQSDVDSMSSSFLPSIKELLGDFEKRNSTSSTADDVVAPPPLVDKNAEIDVVKAANAKAEHRKLSEPSSVKLPGLDLNKSNSICSLNSSPTGFQPKDKLLLTPKILRRTPSLPELNYNANPVDLSASNPELKLPNVLTGEVLYRSRRQARKDLDLGKWGRNPPTNHDMSVRFVSNERGNKINKESTDSHPPAIVLMPIKNKPKPKRQLSLNDNEFRSLPSQHSRSITEKDLRKFNETMGGNNAQTDKCEEWLDNKLG